jgi:hypothetical protein
MNFELKFLPMYLFMGFLLGYLAWEILKFIHFVFTYNSKNKKK